MRHMRKLILHVSAALVVTAFSAPMASATVEVRDGSGALCGSETACEAELTGNDFVWEWTYPTSSYSYTCAITTMSVRGFGDGYVEMWPLDTPGLPEPAGGCSAHLSSLRVNDCQDAGWVGQIVGPGDDGYVGYSGPQPPAGETISQYNLVFDSCWYIGGPAGWTDYDGTTRIDLVQRYDDQGRLYETDWMLPEQTTYTNPYATLTLRAPQSPEMFADGTSIEVTSID